MTIEKADKPKAVVYSVWSPSPIAGLWKYADQPRKRGKRNPLPVPEESRFLFCNPHEMEQSHAKA